MTRRLLTMAAVLVTLAHSAPADAQKRITVGLYAPTAPFIGPSQRLEYITRLAEHMEPAAPGKRVVGRVFSRASALTAAINRGDVQFAVIDAPYAAARGLPYRVVAAAVRGGSTSGSWMLVAKGNVSGLADLSGKTVAIPRIGYRAASFIANVLLESEVSTRYFGSITRAPDAHSAVTLVGLGRAAAALVPSGVRLSRGVRRLVTLRSVQWPMLVATRGVDAALIARVRRRALSFFGGGVLSGFTSATSASYGGLRSSFSRRKPRGPMAVASPSKLGVSGLMRGRTFRIQVADIDNLVTTQ